jgi:hypothetical protein
MLIYGACVNSRVAAGLLRNSPEEAAEAMRRDYAGWASWFFVTPMVQAVTIWAGAKLPMFRQFKNYILERNNPPKALENPKNIWQKTQHFLWRYNPLSRFNIPSFEQISSRKQQALEALEHRLPMHSEKEKEALLKTVDRFFERSSHFPSIARGIGFVMTCLVLGIGVPYMNIVWTRNSLAKKKAQEQAKLAQPSPNEQITFPPVYQGRSVQEIGTIPSQQNPLPFPLPEPSMFVAKQFSQPNSVIPQRTLPNIPVNSLRGQLPMSLSPSPRPSQQSAQPMPPVRQPFQTRFPASVTLQQQSIGPIREEH